MNDSLTFTCGAAAIQTVAKYFQPVEQRYFETIWQRKTYEMEEQEFFIEYQDINLWFSPEIFEPPIFGKFDFLKELDDPAK